MDKYNINMFVDVETEIIQIFSERLKKIRTGANLTQQQFANEIGISVAALSYYETGKRVPDIIFLFKVSEYFCIPIDYFLGKTNSIKKENTNISNKLRLSDKSIENIQNFIDETNEGTFNYYESADILNKILENSNFYSVLNLMTWSGYECQSYMPDEEYIYFIATKKMMNVIIETISNTTNLKTKIIESMIPEQKEREKYYKWILEQSNEEYKAVQEKYEQYKKTLMEREKTLFEKFKSNIRKETDNGKHNAPKE